MKHKNLLLLCTLITTVLFVLLFYRQSIGLNLLLFETAVWFQLSYLQKTNWKNLNTLTVFIGTFLTAILVVLHNSLLAIWVNLISFFLLIGTRVYPASRSLIAVWSSAFSSAMRSVPVLFITLDDSSFRIINWRAVWKTIKIAIIPLFVVWLFIWMYRLSSPFFDEYYVAFTSRFDGWWKQFWEVMNFSLTATIILGFIISLILFMRRTNSAIIREDSEANDELERKRKKKLPTSFKLPLLKYEWRSAMILFVLLNLLLFIVNVLDIYRVWFHFEWQGQFLKQFVHAGTYLLIFSILISMALVLFYFRGNLNFYTKNKPLRFWANTWLIQNAVLAISVAIRNFWYIHYFALAYKRIAVLFFLLLILVGLVTVFIKVNRKRSTFFLFRTNAYSLYVTLLFAALFNWDVIIATYNFSHFKTAFVHLNFLVQLSDKALPWLDYSPDELATIQYRQEDLFEFSKRYMTPEKYHEIIQERKELFLIDYPSRGILSWNYAEYRTFRLLSAPQK